MSELDMFPGWSIDAVNLVEHADNPVHTDEGGVAAGYGGAVVAGTTIFSYLTRPVAEAWGADWVTSGGLEVWFRAPVLADERVEVAGGPAEVVATVANRVCARLAPRLTNPPVGEPVGKRLDPMVLTLDDQWVGYAKRGGEDLELYEREELVHPVVWACLANRVFATQLVAGPWVHTRSNIGHFGAVGPGAEVVIESFETDRFETRSGERAVVDVRFTVDGSLVCAVEHEALVSLS